jgi:hypothetical protein
MPALAIVSWCGAWTALAASIRSLIAFVEQLRDRGVAQPRTVPSLGKPGVRQMARRLSPSLIREQMISASSRV